MALNMQYNYYIFTYSVKYDYLNIMS